MNSNGKAPNNQTTTLGNIKYENFSGISGVYTPKETLKLESGNCVSTTRLFMALARASGIPCRQVTGLIFIPEKTKTKYSGNPGGAAHTWAEIYLPIYSWMPVDASFKNPKEDYCCFDYKIHIKEYYGDFALGSGGLSYRSDTIEAKSFEQFDEAPASLQNEIEIELLP